MAGYRGATRDAYALDLRQFVAWCDQHDLRLLEVRRADIECFARDLEVVVFELAPLCPRCPWLALGPVRPGRPQRSASGRSRQRLGLLAGAFYPDPRAAGPRGEATEGVVRDWSPLPQLSSRLTLAVDGADHRLE
jgi:hypothetical protein